MVSRVIIDNRSRSHGSVTEPRAPASGLRTPSETLDQVEKISQDTTLEHLRTEPRTQVSGTTGPKSRKVISALIPSTYKQAVCLVARRLSQTERVKRTSAPSPSPSESAAFSRHLVDVVAFAVALACWKAGGQPFALYGPGPLPFIFPELLRR